MPTGGTAGGVGGGAQAVGAVALGGALLGLAAYGISQLDERKRQNAPDVQMSPISITGGPVASSRSDSGGRLLVLWDMWVEASPASCLTSLNCTLKYYLIGNVATCCV